MMDGYHWAMGAWLIAVILAITIPLTCAMTAANVTGTIHTQWQVKSVAHGHAEYVPDGDGLEWRWLDHAGCGEGGE